MAFSVAGIWENTKEAWDSARRELFAAGGKKGIEAVVTSTNTAGVASAGSAAAGAGSGFFSIFGVGVATAVSAVLEQIEYRLERNKLRDMYKEEIASQLKKSPKDITDDDLDRVAKGDVRKGVIANHTIAAQISQQRKERNLGIGVSAISMLGTLALVKALAIPASLAVGGVAVPGIIASIVIGMALYKFIETPLKWAGNKILGLEKETVHDRIHTIAKEHRRGKSVSREHVLEVFIAANPQLQSYVKAQYGQEFDKLGVTAKRHLAETMDNYLPLTQLTEAINTGRMNATELAFTVEGIHSGVLPKEMQMVGPTSVLGKANAALREIGHKFGFGQHTQAQPQTPPAVQGVAPQRKLVEYDNDVPARSFAARIEAERAQSQAQGHTLH